MNSVMFGETGRLRTSSVLLAGLALSALALTVNTQVAAAAPAVLGAPNDLPPLSPARLMLATLPAVLGNTLGFFLAYRSPHPRALLKFLVPAALFFVLFMLPALWALLTGGSLAAFAVATVINVVPVAVAVPVLLSLRPSQETSAAAPVRT